MKSKIIKKFTLSFLIICVASLSFNCKSGQHYKGPKQLIAVPDFINSTQKKLDKEFITGLTDMFISELIKSGRFNVVERSRLEELLKEHALEMSGVLQANDAIKIGKMAQSPYVILASISNYNIEEDNMQSGPMSQTIAKLKIVLTARVIKTESGIGVAAAEGKIDTTIVKHTIDNGMTRMNMGGDPKNFDSSFRDEITKAVSELTEDLCDQDF